MEYINPKEYATHLINLFTFDFDMCHGQNVKASINAINLILSLDNAVSHGTDVTEYLISVKEILLQELIIPTI